jgi:hypothetical protein
MFCTAPSPPLGHRHLEWDFPPGDRLGSTKDKPDAARAPEHGLGGVALRRRSLIGFRCNPTRAPNVVDHVRTHGLEVKSCECPTDGTRHRRCSNQLGQGKEEAAPNLGKSGKDVADCTSEQSSEQCRCPCCSRDVLFCRRNPSRRGPDARQKQFPGRIEHCDV